jgi:hypothetical protein
VESNKPCCIAGCEQEASVIDQGTTSTLKMSLPFCLDHFELWSSPYTLGKCVDSIDFQRVQFSPAAGDYPNPLE